MVSSFRVSEIFTVLLSRDHTCQCRQSRAGALLVDMEMWQQQGYESFGAWRRASEKARRAAKKAAAMDATTAEAPPSPRPPPPPPRATWQPPQQIPLPSSPNSPVQLKDSAGLLPGNLHERVMVTPHGSREHTLEHTSPGGTTRVEEYASPVGVQLTRAARCAWRLQVAAERREERVAREQCEREERKAARLESAAPAAADVSASIFVPVPPEHVYMEE